MTLKKTPDGRRSVRVEVEIPGTPEQVWQAIATGPGITAWFVPSTVEEKEGGKTTNDFGGGMVSEAKITVWDPPHRFCAEDKGWMPGMPPVATEWTVEAKGGGTCIVRVVHSLFASTDDWDGQLEGTESGWGMYFRVLRRYLQEFAGEPCHQALGMAMSGEPIGDVWTKLCGAIGLSSPKPGQAFRVPLSKDLAITGEVERIDPQGAGHSVLARVNGPVQGTLTLGAYSCGGVMASVQVFGYGKDAKPTMERAGPLVQAWLGGLFPAPVES